MIQRRRHRHPADPARVPAGGRRRALPTAALAACSLAALGAAAALSARFASAAPGRELVLIGVDQVVELGVLAAGALVGWWLAATLVATLVCAWARALGRRWAAGERFVARHAPAIVRRGLALSVGAGIGLVTAVAPAGAQSAEPPADLGWVATQVVGPVAAARPPTADAPPETAPPHAEPAVAEPAVAAEPAEPAARVTVRPGDTLWAIAARHLDPDASAIDIAAAWPRWYEANSAVVGADPDRIRPGQVLTAPAAEPAAPSAAPGPPAGTSAGAGS